LVKKIIVILEHPTYSPCLVPCDPFLFPTMEIQLKVTMAILNSLQKTSGNASIVGNNNGINV
jgi:hypothetical protein